MPYGGPVVYDGDGPTVDHVHDVELSARPLGIGVWGLLMRSRILAIGIMALVLALVLAGCGQEPTKIRVTVGMWPEPYLREDVAMFEEWKRLFEADYPQYEIVGVPYTYSPDTFFPMAQSGQTPTVFQTWFTEPQKLIDNGFVRDITAQLQQLGWYDKMDPVMREMLSRDGKVYGVPRDGYGLGLLINLQIFEEVGLVDDWNGDGILDIHGPDGSPRYPTTFQELAETARYISETMRDQFEREVAGLIILSANNTGGWQFSNIAWNFGARLQVQDADGRWVANLNAPEAVEALEWIKELRWEAGALPASTSLTYSDWYSYIGTGRAAMAFVGSDAIALPVTNFGMDRDLLAFVPMPAGPRGHRYALFGGTPFMFAANATDEQVMGALRFLEYMGRSPETSPVALSSLRLGMKTAIDKGMPILPEIRPWVNEEYRAATREIEAQYANVYMPNFQDFYDLLPVMRRPEEPHYTQEMYEILDAVIQQVLADPNANPAALLTSANNTFQTHYLSKLR